MKKLFSLLALATIISFTVSADVGTNESCGGGACAGGYTTETSMPDIIDAESEAIGSKFDGTTSAHDPFTLDSSAKSPERSIYEAGAKAVSDLAHIEQTWTSHIENSINDQDPYLEYRRAALQDQITTTSQIVAKVSEGAQQRLSAVLDRYNTRFKAATDRDEEFAKTAAEATASATKTMNSHIPSFKAGVDAKVKNMGFGQFHSSNIIFTRSH